MPTPALLLLIATLLPLASFVLLVFAGKRIGNPLSGWVATAAISGSFVCSMLALMAWLSPQTYRPAIGAAPIEWGMGKNPINLSLPWLPVGEGVKQAHGGYLDLGIYIDSLTIVMFVMITLVSALIHLFSIGYMGEDKGFPRFFTHLSLFCFSMLGLVVGGTIVQLFIFWELVGLCSYLLIGFWHERKSASNAAIKAFVTNRIGDCGFLIGFGILFYHLGNATLPNIWAALDVSKMTERGIQIAGSGWISPGLMTMMGIALFFGAVGKSAQFPLHVWLPDAMEGPTPVSALIHAATMVAAGVYMVGRIFPILTADARLFMAIIGVTTLTMAALIAVAQSDIKKVLAYSTVSQLGYMILAMGIGSWVGGLFHLITHAFFKALLFLGAGSVIHGGGGEQELAQYGGLWRKMPVTATTFAIGVLAIAGAPGLAGYYSKDLILLHAGAFSWLATHGAHGSRYYWLLFILPTAMAYVTGFYMTRCWMLTFWGRPRNQRVYEQARELPIMWVPLFFLAALSIVGGYELTNVKGLIKSAMVENTQYVKTMSAGFEGFSQAWAAPSEEPQEEAAAIAQEVRQGEQLVGRYVVWAPLAGIVLGMLVYWKGYAAANMLMRITPLRWVHRWLYRRMYFDELYMGTLVAITIGLSRLSSAIDKHIIDGLADSAAGAVRRLASAAGLHDQYVIDGAVEGLAGATQGLGSAARAPQTGRIRIYVLALLAVLAMGMAAAIAVALSR